MIFMDTENSKTNESPKFVLNLSQRLDVKSSNKHVTLRNMFILLKMLTVEIELTDIQDYFQ